MDVNEIIEYIEEDKTVSVEEINKLEEEDLYYMLTEIKKDMVVQEENGWITTIDFYLKHHRPDFYKKYMVIFKFHNDEI